MNIKAIRGATTVDNNNSEDILLETEKLLIDIIKKNNLKKEEIISMTFTATADLNAEYPAKAARNLGYTDIALMCMEEMKVVGSLNSCIRVMVLIQSNENKTINHVYLKKAKNLRLDIFNEDKI